MKKKNAKIERSRHKLQQWRLVAAATIASTTEHCSTAYLRNLKNVQIYLLLLLWLSCVVVFQWLFFVFVIVFFSFFVAFLARLSTTQQHLRRIIFFFSRERGMRHSYEHNIFFFIFNAFAKFTRGLINSINILFLIYPTERLENFQPSFLSTGFYDII